jgi:lipopolysaccharide transport system permease protein
MRLFAWLLAPLKTTMRHHKLIATLIENETANLYSGTVFSYLWSVVTPLVTLGVYTFVFSGVLKSSFNPSISGSQHAHFALNLFAGLIMWEFASTVISKSPTIITSRPNYVKKIVFPVHILPIVGVGAALIQFLISYGILLASIGIYQPSTAWRAVSVPFFLVPILLYSTGLSWFLSSIGVFFRDIANAINPVLQLLWFSSAIFFPVSSVPSSFQWFFWANPVAACIDQCRKFTLLGESINLHLMVIHLFLGYLVACIGLAFFRKTQPTFADVL